MITKQESKKKKILVVEDEKPLLMAIKSKLEIEGYEVVFAEDGEKGEELIKTEKPDLLLLDILLPKKDGFEILEDLKKEKIVLPIIIISNSGQPVEIERAKNLGVLDFLIKANFSPAEVLEKVEQVFSTGATDEKKEGEQSEEEALLEEKSEFTAPPVADGMSRILVVEDDEFLREVMCQKLIKEGFGVSAAIDAMGAFEEIKKSLPHLILLDLILPGMDGFEFLSQFKKDAGTKNIPVIVLSNLGQKEDVDRAMSMGAADYMVKANFTPAEIVQKIRDILGKEYM